VPCHIMGAVQSDLKSNIVQASSGHVAIPSTLTEFWQTVTSLHSALALMLRLLTRCPPSSGNVQKPPNMSLRPSPPRIFAPCATIQSPSTTSKP
jgi:hypothetical protein